MSALRLVKEPAAGYAASPALPRVPDELLLANLPAPALRLWLAIRKRQGDNVSAWHPASHYADMADVHPKKVYGYLDVLVAYGWIQKGDGKHLACRVGRAYPPSQRGRAGVAKAESTTLQGVERTTTLQGVEPHPTGGTTTTLQGGHTNPERIQKESSHAGRGPASESGEDSDPLGSSVPRPSASEPDPLGFDAFWETYGRKEKRAKTSALWARLPARTRRAIMDHLPGFVASTPEVRFRPHPLTYLHGERWKDEALPPAPIPKPVRPPVDVLGMLLPADRDRAVAETPGLSPADFVLASTDSRTGLGLYRLSSAARIARGLPAPR